MLRLSIPMLTLPFLRNVDPLSLLHSFGYVVEGADFLQDIKEGDIITSAVVTDGLDSLVQPKE